MAARPKSSPKSGKARNRKSRALAFRAIFAAGCFSAFAIFGWDIEISTVLSLLLLLVIAMAAMFVPAAIFVFLLKICTGGFPGLTNKIRSGSMRKDDA